MSLATDRDRDDRASFDLRTWQGFLRRDHGVDVDVAKWQLSALVVEDAHLQTESCDLLDRVVHAMAHELRNNNRCQVYALSRRTIRRRVTAALK